MHFSMLSFLSTVSPFLVFGEDRSGALKLFRLFWRETLIALLLITTSFRDKAVQRAHVALKQTCRAEIRYAFAWGQSAHYLPWLAVIVRLGHNCPAMTTIARHAAVNATAAHSQSREGRSTWKR